MITLSYTKQNWLHFREKFFWNGGSKNKITPSEHQRAAVENDGQLKAADALRKRCKLVAVQVPAKQKHPVSISMC